MRMLLLLFVSLIYIQCHTTQELTGVSTSIDKKQNQDVVINWEDEVINTEVNVSEKSVPYSDQVLAGYTRRKNADGTYTSVPRYKTVSGTEVTKTYTIKAIGHIEVSLKNEDSADGLEVKTFSAEKQKQFRERNLIGNATGSTSQKSNRINIPTEEWALKNEVRRELQREIENYLANL